MVFLLWCVAHYEVSQVVYVIVSGCHVVEPELSAARRHHRTVASTGQVYVTPGGRQTRI